MERKNPLMSRKHFFHLIVLAIALSPLSALAEMQEYIREYTYRVGDADSKVTSREISMQEIKVELLGELGTYINSRVEISQNDKDTDEFKQEVTALTAGFVRVDMIEEKFDGETYYLKAKLSADPDDIVKRINKLGENDEQSQEDKQRLVQAYEESEALRAELAALRAQLAQSTQPEEKQAQLLRQYAKEAEQLSVTALFELGDDYYYGRKGKPQDYQAAVSWYRKAAAQGHAGAQASLGYMVSAPKSTSVSPCAW